MYCAISGESPQEPVISAKSGHLFEKRLLVKFIETNGVDPMNQEPMDLTDILPLHISTFVKPKAPSASSLPNLLLTFQNEWDAVMLETFTLKQEFHATRLELANALYENDAAKRVIARLVKERDDARTQLASYSAHASAHQSAHQSVSVPTPTPSKKSPKKVEKVEMEVDSSELIEKLDAVAQELSAARRKRKTPETLASIESLGSYVPIAKVEEFTRNKEVDVASLDVLSTSHGDWILVASVDGNVSIVNKEGEKLASHKAHAKPMNAAVWVDETTFATCSVDGTVKIWHIDGKSLKIKAHQTVKVHEGPVTGLALHPTKEHVVSIGQDGLWALIHVASGSVVTSQKSSVGLTAVMVHPDGLILGTGCSDAQIRLWDLKTGENVQTFEGHTGSISSLAFSENGYLLATSSTLDSAVKFWDLRKLTNTHDLECGTGITSVKFDRSGVYIVSAAEDRVWVHLVKKWNQVALFEDAGTKVSDVAFGPDAQYLVVGSHDAFVTFGTA